MDSSCGRSLTLRVKVVAKMVLPWHVRHAACVVRRFAIETDGRSSQHRLRGKEFKSSLAVLGETIDSRLVRSAQAKLEARWSSGIFSVRRDESDVVIVGNPTRVDCASLYRREPCEGQWSSEEVQHFHRRTLESNGTKVGRSYREQEKEVHHEDSRR